MTLCHRATTGVVHPRANNWMFLVKQRFPVVQRGANRCFYWSQVYIMCEEETSSVWTEGTAYLCLRCLGAFPKKVRHPHFTSGWEASQRCFGVYIKTAPWILKVQCAGPADVWVQCFLRRTKKTDIKKFSDESVRKNGRIQSMVEGCDCSQNRKTSIHLTNNRTDSITANARLFTYYSFIIWKDMATRRKQHQNSCIFILAPLNLEFEDVIINVIHWLKDKVALFKITLIFGNSKDKETQLESGYWKYDISPNKFLYLYNIYI